ETNGQCGDATGAGVDNGRGHGGGEFYPGQWRDWHDQTALGATTHVPGYGEVISTHYDPGLQEGQEAYARSQGWRAFLNEDGTTPRSATLTYAANPPNETGQFGKAGGLGELSALVGEAPVEIGNRVWIDQDQDGIQDPGESPVEGVTVNLYDAEGTQVSTTTTDAQGTYYFNDSNVEGGLAPEADYTLALDEPSDAEPGGPLAGYTLTTSTAGDHAGIDSDAELVDEFPVVEAQTPLAGADHSFDIGFIRDAGECTVGDYVWIDRDADGVQGDDEPGLEGVTVELLDADGNVVETATTDGEGQYLFEGVECAEYQVRFTLPEDSGFEFTEPGVGDDPVVDSNPEPTDDPLVGVTPSFEVTPEDPEDLTIDAGVIAPGCSLGGIAWSDADGNGIHDEDEPGLE